LYKVEPCVCVTACNLFAKDMLRSALADEMEEVGPKVPLVSKPISLPAALKGWHGQEPVQTGDRQAIRRGGGMGPDADSGEKVALGKSSEVVRCDIFNTPFVNFARAICPAAMRLRSHCAANGSISLVSCRVMPPSSQRHGAADQLNGSGGTG
jgi:hypothetical protein